MIERHGDEGREKRVELILKMKNTIRILLDDGSEIIPHNEATRSQILANLSRKNSLHLLDDLLKAFARGMKNISCGMEEEEKNQKLVH